MTEKIMVDAKHTAGPWSPEPPARGCKSWNVTRLNPRAPVGIEYLMGPKRPRSFRSRDAAQAASDAANAALATSTEGGQDARNDPLSEQPRCR